MLVSVPDHDPTGIGDTIPSRLVFPDPPITGHVAFIEKLVISYETIIGPDAGLIDFNGDNVGFSVNLTSGTTHVENVDDYENAGILLSDGDVNGSHVRGMSVAVYYHFEIS